MARKLYTRSHNISLLQQINNNGAQFTADEHSWLTEHESSEHFESYDALMSWYLAMDSGKLLAITYLAGMLRARNRRSVISFGAAPCVLEHLLQYALGGEVEVVATDFDRYMVQAAERLFTNIRACYFDVFHDEVEAIRPAEAGCFDTALFFGSSYVLDDTEFIRFMGDLRAAGIQEIVDFQSGFLSLRTSLGYLAPSQALKRMLGRAPGPTYLTGKFHGYGRTRRELRRLYRAAGLRLVGESAVGTYKYVAVCSTT